jgi:hypothetical protein
MAGAASDGIYRVKYSQGNPGNVAHKHVRSSRVRSGFLKKAALARFPHLLG